MKTLPKLAWLRKGTKLPSGTGTARLAGDPAKVRAGERVRDEADVRDWLGGTTSHGISEESIGLGGYGKVLTVLSSRTIGREEDDLDEEEDEEALIKSWTPRFR